MSGLSWFLFCVVALLGCFVFAQLLPRYLGSITPRTDTEILVDAGFRFLSGNSLYCATDNCEHTKPPLLSPLLALLSFPPRTWVLWGVSLINILLPIGLLRYWKSIYHSHSSSLYFWIANASAFLVMRASWRDEIKLGQYNLILLGLLFLSHSLMTKKKGAWAGLATLLQVLIKPSQIMLLPWLSVEIKEKKLKALGQILFGSTCSLIGLVGLYLFFRSPAQLLGDHLDWNRFLKEVSIPRHILRPDNLGLPSLFNRHGFPWPLSGSIPLLITALALVWIEKVKLHPRLSFHLLVWMSLAFSPLTWKQNFTLFFPLAFDLFIIILESNQLKNRALASIGAFFLFLSINFKLEVVEASYKALWASASPPIWFSLLSIGCFASAHSSSRALERS